jgi:signal transduction histidine kinase
MAAHDLRKPLGLVLSYSDLLTDELDVVASEEAGTFLDRIRVACRSMAKLVDDYLDVALMEAGRFPIDPARMKLDDVIRRSLVIVAPLAKRRDVALRWEPPDDLGALVADEAKLEQVLINLVGNAVEHSPAGQSVEIEAHRGTAEVTLWVHDRGPGIPRKLRDKLFEPFEHGGRTAAKSGGVGLGLAIARVIVETHGGRLTFGDRPGGGTTFRVVLPDQVRNMG